VINIITVKWGTLYSADYVNKMYEMIKRHLTLPHTFYCLTEDDTGLDKNIKIKPLPLSKLQGWWYKAYAFKQNLFPDNHINFYIDLDSVITGNIDKFMTYKPTQFLGLRDLIYTKHPERIAFGSGIMRWANNRFQYIWTRLELNNGIADKYQGDQDYLYHYHANNIQFFPTEWSTSYKWEYVDGIRKKDSSIIVFHGHPRPHEVDDKYILDNWR
jgi:hypothetical protein